MSVTLDPTESTPAQRMTAALNPTRLERVQTWVACWLAYVPGPPAWLAGRLFDAALASQWRRAPSLEPTPVAEAVLDALLRTRP